MRGGRSRRAPRRSRTKPRASPPTVQQPAVARCTPGQAGSGSRSRVDRGRRHAIAAPGPRESRVPSRRIAGRRWSTNRDGLARSARQSRSKARSAWPRRPGACRAEPARRAPAPRTPDRAYRESGRTGVSASYPEPATKPLICSILFPRIHPRWPCKTRSHGVGNRHVPVDEPRPRVENIGREVDECDASGDLDRPRNGPHSRLSTNRRLHHM